ncbi:uncharacterized protein LOC118510659 isoform X2 [Anopheles stephensi]|uniref:uncharacterized protein LOC118510659 isoform X2 n=1 Tax=Anopheles stephensi TaxID=30069 RepID=UPI001658914D|nr:uncharacterized protein LOC118510659 isoform X2 [Anopheles stephensi]
MKSSMAITKSAAFRFMLLLHLFLKVKMCVGFVDALAVGDSDINYEDSDEWLRDVTGGGGRLPISTTASIPVSANLMRWEEPSGGHHAGHRFRMHHVRHEQHYLKHRPVKVVPNVGESTMVALDPEVQQTGSQQQQKSRHHNSHHSHHHTHHTPHHVQHQLSKHGRKSGASDASQEEVSLVELNRQEAAHRAGSHPFERRAPFEKRNFNDVWDSVSGGSREVQQQDRQVAINRKRSASSFHALTSNALTGDGSSRSSRVAAAASDRTTKQQQSVNPRSKNYFEELLNNYKSSSPYYKELHQARSPQTKALPPGKRNQRSSAEVFRSVSKAKAPPAATDGDLDYLYDDETDDSVQNDAPAGGAMSTSTPSTTTTTTTTSTTTARSIESSVDSDESSANESNDGTSEADTSYSSYYQKAYAMHSNPRRNGNNRYNSIGTRPQSPVQQQQHQSHTKRLLHSDRIDPAQQVSYPGRYESLTDYKQANFGSKDAVERSYNAYNNIHSARREAMNHLDRMHTEGKCQVPRPKIVPASNDRTKIFTPHCTILHRCEDDTGCCMPPLTCAPKSTTEVKLFFYVKNVGPRQQNTVTTLTFTNHTECHCVQLDPVHFGQSASSRPQILSSLEQNGAEGSGGSSGATSRISNSCTCPRHYKSVFDSESHCYCDCLSSDRDCIRFKEGFENFSMETRKCIRSKKCNVPHCEYGTYNRHEGRCPKKSDRMNEHFPQYR